MLWYMFFQAEDVVRYACYGLEFRRGLFRSPEMLMQIGKPYQSSKGRPGGGLGLFLVVNVVRKFGGRVSARNHPDGGAEVTLQLPMASLSIEDQHVGSG